jgi:hypothetical protein
MRIVARCVVVAAAVVALFVIPAVAARLDVDRAPSGPRVTPVTYGYPPEARR